MFNIKKFLYGIRIIPRPTVELESDSKGEMEVDDASGKLVYHNGATRSPAVTEDHAATLSNKTIGDSNIINAQDDAFEIQDAADSTVSIDFDAAGTTGTGTTIQSSQTVDRTLILPDASDTLVGKATEDTFTNKTFDAQGTGNSLSNVNTTHLALGVLDTDISDGVSASHDTLVSALAVKTYVDDQILTKDDASEISYTPIDVTDWDLDTDPGDVDDALDQLAQRQTDHEAASSLVHGLGVGDGNVVGESASQTLTNKTIDLAGVGANTLSNVTTSNFALNVIDQDLSATSGSHDTLASALAVKTYVDDQIAAKDDASEITYTPTVLSDWNGGLDPGNVDGGLNQLAERITSVESEAGVSIIKTQAAHGFAVGDAIYHDGLVWAKALADDPATLTHYVVIEVVDVNNFRASKFGEVTATAHGFTVGEHYFLSDTVAGQPTSTEPDQYSSPLFYVEDANTLHMEVYRPSEIGDNTGGPAPSGDDNFSYEVVDAIDTITIPLGQQMAVFDNIEINGVLAVEGSLILEV